MGVEWGSAMPALAQAREVAVQAKPSGAMITVSCEERQVEG
jgi:hypothetical protein